MFQEIAHIQHSTIVGKAPCFLEWVANSLGFNKSQTQNFMLKNENNITKKLESSDHQAFSSEPYHCQFVRAIDFRQYLRAVGETCWETFTHSKHDI